MPVHRGDALAAGLKDRSEAIEALLEEPDIGLERLAILDGATPLTTDTVDQIQQSRERHTTGRANDKAADRLTQRIEPLRRVGLRERDS